MARKKKGFGELDLGLAWEEIEKVVEQIAEAWDKEDLGALVSHLLSLAGKIGEVSPELAPVLGALIESYGNALVPVWDQLAILGAKAIGYGFEKAAEVGENIAPYVERYERVRAKSYAMKVGALKEVGFSQEEAMNILLTEIAKSAQPSGGSAVGFLRDIFKDFPKKNKDEQED